MTCTRCGSRCQGRFCAACERDERYGGFSGGCDAAIDNGVITYECGACPHCYTATELQACPECGQRRARAIADGEALLPDRVEQYIARNLDASVVHVLGKFVLDPEEYAAPVAVALDTDDPSADDGGEATLGGVET